MAAFSLSYNVAATALLALISGSRLVYAMPSCFFPPMPLIPACPVSSGSSFVDACGQRYYVYCGSDTISNAANSYTVTSIEQCMELCSLNSNCQSSVFTSGVCYIDTTFNGLRTSAVPDIVTLIKDNGPGTLDNVCQNNTAVADRHGVSYTQYCGMDAAGPDPDLGSTRTSGAFTDCGPLCDSTTNCGKSFIRVKRPYWTIKHALTIVHK